MSNRIDFFQSAQTSLALPAASVSIFVDGTICPVLQPIEIVRDGWPEFSSARLIYNPAAHTNINNSLVEDIEFEFAMGKTICIHQYYNSTPPGTAAFSLPIFCGQIDSIETNFSSEDQTAEIIARDFSVNLKRVTVYGRRLAKTDGSDMFLPGFDTIFNPDGQGNASTLQIQVNGKNFTAFCAESLQAKLWSFAEVIYYLLCEYVPADQLHIPTIDQLKALTDNKVVHDLDVTGLNLTEALHRCCERIGLQFKFVPRLGQNGPEQAIVFYRNGTGRTVELNCQRDGQQISISKTNIATLHKEKNFWPVTHKYIGQGDFKLYEATFELVKAWDPSLEDTDFDKFSPSTNSDFHLVKDIYRKWCLNEAGQYSSIPYSQGDAFDFTKIFQSNQYAQHQRRFRPCLSKDKMGQSKGYYLQVSYDDGENWSQYLHSFNILTDECGVWLSSDQLDEYVWAATQNGTLYFRITASVESDDRLSCAIADGPIDSVSPVIEHVIMQPQQFKYRKVSSLSIFWQTDDDSLGEPDEADDTNALYEFVRQTAQTTNQMIEIINIQTPTIALDYQIGDIVSTSPESRDLLSCSSDNRSIRWIERVQMDFQKQCTNLKIVRQRKP